MFVTDAIKRLGVVFCDRVNGMHRVLCPLFGIGLNGGAVRPAAWVGHGERRLRAISGIKAAAEVVELLTFEI